jgi:hypothetical protein
LKKLEDELNTIEEKRIFVEHLIEAAKKDIQQTIDAGTDRAKSLYSSSGELVTLASQTTALTGQVSGIETRLSKLENKGTGGSAEDHVVTQLGEIQDLTDKLSTQTSSLPTVFVQFAGGTTRDQINELMNSIRVTDKYILPGGAQRIGTAAGLHEVRYFYKEDKSNALDLKNDVTEALKSAGYNNISIDVPPPIEGLKKPQPGVLELWLELPKR